MTWTLQLFIEIPAIFNFYYGQRLKEKVGLGQNW